MTSTRPRRATVAALLALMITGAALAAQSLVAGPASAVTSNRYVATTGSDTAGAAPNDCLSKTSPCKTIQHAVNEASSGDTVHIAAGTYPESVVVGTGEDTPGDLTFIGAGAGATKITGNPAEPIEGASVGFLVDGSPATLVDLSVTGVQRSTGEGSEPGIGVFAGGSQLTLTDVVVSDNADSGVLGIDSAVTASGSQFDANGSSTSVDEGFPFLGCGAFVLSGTLSIDTSSASSNQVCGAGDFADFELVRRAADVPATGLSFTRSTAADNKDTGVVDQGDADGRVVDSTLSGNAGAGVYSEDSTIQVANSTITGTKTFTGATAGGQGGITVQDETPDRALVPSAAAVRTSRLLKRYSRARAGSRALAIHRPALSPTTSTVTVSGSIVADNVVADCSTAVTDAGYNISSDSANSCGFSSGNHSQLKTNPKLGPLGAHGGLTETELPLKLSPAIDAVPAGSAGCTSGATDQRGVARPQPTGGRCDIGSVELAGAQLAISPDSLPHGTVGKSYKQTLTATGGQYPTYTWAFVSGTLPPGITFANGVFSGTPTKAGTYTVTISVNDPADKTYTIVIDAAPTTPDHGNGAGGKLADTGVSSRTLIALAMLLLVAGLAALYTAGRIDLPGGRHRRTI